MTDPTPELTISQIAEEELDFSGRISILTAESLIEESKALDLIQEALVAQEWNADTADRIAEIVRRTGRSVTDLED